MHRFIHSCQTSDQPASTALYQLMLISSSVPNNWTLLSISQSHWLGKFCYYCQFSDWPSKIHISFFKLFNTSYLNFCLSLGIQFYQDHGHSVSPSFHSEIWNTCQFYQKYTDVFFCSSFICTCAAIFIIAAFPIPATKIWTLRLDLPWSVQAGFVIICPTFQAIFQSDL